MCAAIVEDFRKYNLKEPHQTDITSTSPTEAQIGSIWGSALLPSCTNLKLGTVIRDDAHMTRTEFHVGTRRQKCRTARAKPRRGVLRQI